MKFETKNSLFWRTSFVFLLLLLLIGLAYVFITAYSAQQYYAETTQRLNSHVAEHMLLEVQPFIDGEVNEDALHHIMHSMMAVNPMLEVYLLDNEGKILSYVVLDKKVKLQYVEIEPIQEFVQTKGKQFVLGDDPRNPGNQTVFSATPVSENGKQLGFVYMVLVSEQYENISDTLWNSYLLNLSSRFFLLTLSAAFVLGLIIIWLLTRNLRKIIETVRQFEKGNLQARIPIKSSGELANLSHTFNHMADTILGNIEDLKQVDKLRRELIANVSHDLRTPLAVIHGYVETMMMKQGKMSPEEEQKYLQIILNSSDNLKKLVSDLFELTKLEARQVELSKQPFVISELIWDAHKKYEVLAQAKNLKIHTEIDAKEAVVYADLRLMERVIQNLVDNAIKYSPEDSEINLKLSQEGKEVVVSVSNSGEGIAEEELPQIFNRYYKTEKHTSQNKSTGLGLAIVKNILEMHNSLIQVKSKLNQYTTFYFQLPIYQ